MKMPKHSKWIGLLSGIILLIGAAQCQAGDSALFKAIHDRSFESVKKALDEGADPNAPGDAGKLPLGAVADYFNGSEEELVQVIKLLLSYKANPNAQELDGKSSIIWVAWQGKPEAVKVLIDGGANVNAKDKESGTALMFAAGYGQTETVRVLLDHGADINAQDKYGDTALMRASKYDVHQETVRFLLQRGADVNSQKKFNEGSQQGATPLIVAAQEGNLNNLKILLENGADVSLDDGRGTALDRAITSGNEQIFDILLTNKKSIGKHTFWVARENKEKPQFLKKIIETGIDPNTEDEYGQTPFSAAIDDGNLELVKALIENKAEINHQNKQTKETMLMRAVSQGNANIVRLLLEHKADPDLSNGSETALTLAAKKGSIDITKLIIEAGADLVDNFTGHWQALPIAAEEGHADIVKMLVEKGAPMDRRFGFSRASPLMLAARAGHLQVVQYLMEHGAKLEEQSLGMVFWGGCGTKEPDTFIGTPLMWAARGGHLEVVRYLLDKGADPSAKNTLGETAQSVAAAKGHQEIVKLLFKRLKAFDAKSDLAIASLVNASHSGDIKTIALFLDRGVFVDAVDKNGLTPLLAAVQARKTDAVKYLLQKSASVNLATTYEYGATPLILTAKPVYGAGGEKERAELEKTSLDIAKILIEAGAQVNTKDTIGQCPVLGYAISQNNPSLVEFLLNAGADVNAIVESYSPKKTVLMLAVTYGNAEVVSALLKKGANIMAKDETGLTAIDLAKKEKHQDIALLLQQALKDQ